MSKSVRIVAVAIVALVAVFVPSEPPHAAAAEPSADYYYNAGHRLPLGRSATRVALVVSDPSARAVAVARTRALGSVADVRDVKAGGVVEVTLPSSAKAPSTELQSVARAAGGAIVPVFYESVERDVSTLFVNDEALVRFRPDVSADTVAETLARFGADAIGSLRYAPNGFKIRVGSSDLSRNALTVANGLYETGLCVWAHPNFLAHRSPRFVPNDPLYANQWHLNNTGQGMGTAGADVKAQAAWDVTQGSSSISIAVADTGIDYNHEDLNTTVGGLPKVHDPRDVVHADNDPSPQPGDADGAHGTAASGVATAAFNNGLDTAGIAPMCRFVPIQLYAESTFTPNSTEADAFTWAADHADIMSNSWGPDVAGTALPDATRAAMDYCATNGRGGKGTVIFFAAGNSNFNIDLNNNDTYSAYPGVVAVAASTNRDKKSSYSSFGPSISVCAPSSGGTLGITTIDATGNGGYGPGNTTSGFGGTSSACPLAAGVGALVLSVNPNLTWREVKSVLEQSADKVDVGSTFGQYDALGHSIYYGYGRVNAQRAVALALVGGPDTPGLYSGGTYLLRDSSSSGPATAAFTFGNGSPTLKAISGDWDGNGTSTVGLYDPASGTFFLRNANTPGAADLAFTFGPGGAGALPVVGDWDGNGTTTVGIYLPSTGAFFLRNSNTPGPADLAFQFGAAPSSLKPIVGDWNNDGIDSVGLYDSATGAFFLKNANAPGAADLVFTYGGSGAGLVAVAGDWNNDGADSIGVYDPATGGFFLRSANSAGLADAVFVYGAGGATPLIGNWDGY